MLNAFGISNSQSFSDAEKIALASEAFWVWLKRYLCYKSAFSPPISRHNLKVRWKWHWHPWIFDLNAYRSRNIICHSTCLNITPGVNAYKWTLRIVLESSTRSPQVFRDILLSCKFTFDYLKMKAQKFELVELLHSSVILPLCLLFTSCWAQSTKITRHYYWLEILPRITVD